MKKAEFFKTLFTNRQNLLNCFVFSSQKYKFQVAFLNLLLTKSNLIYIILKVQVRGDFMRIDLNNLLSGVETKLDINYVLDLSNLIYSTYNPIKNGVNVVGRLYSKADVLYLDINISFDFFGFCDRCAEKVKKHFSFDVKRIVVEKLENEEDDDDYIVVSNRELDLDELVNEEVSLSLPNKILCKEDCKGLCPKCGANLNVKQCNCKKDVDPRMAALLQLLEDE